MKLGKLEYVLYAIFLGTALIVISMLCAEALLGGFLWAMTGKFEFVMIGMGIFGRLTLFLSVLSSICTWIWLNDYFEEPTQ